MNRALEKPVAGKSPTFRWRTGKSGTDCTSKKLGSLQDAVQDVAEKCTPGQDETGQDIRYNVKGYWVSGELVGAKMRSSLNKMNLRPDCNYCYKAGLHDLRILQRSVTAQPRNNTLSVRIG